jgi:hypothetical protein
MPPYEKSNHAAILGHAAREPELPAQVTVSREFFQRVSDLDAAVATLKGENKRLAQELEALKKLMLVTGAEIQARLAKISLTLTENTENAGHA